MERPDRPVSHHEMRYPSGGLVVLDAGALLAAGAGALEALQATLQEAAEALTDDGRPFRAATHDTPLGPVLVAPVSARDTAHAADVARADDGTAVRLVVDLGGGGLPGDPAMLPPREPGGGGETPLDRPEGAETAPRVPPPSPPGEAEPGDGIGTLPSQRVTEPAQSWETRDRPPPAGESPMTPEPADLPDPATLYVSPRALAEDESRPRAERVALLRSWEYAAREEAVATGEGMPEGAPTLLSEIGRALEGLGERPGGPSAPTRHGGDGD